MSAVRRRARPDTFPFVSGALDRTPVKFQIIKAPRGKFRCVVRGERILPMAKAVFCIFCRLEIGVRRPRAIGKIRAAAEASAVGDFPWRRINAAFNPQRMNLSTIALMSVKQRGSACERMVRGLRTLALQPSSMSHKSSHAARVQRNHRARGTKSLSSLMLVPVAIVTVPAIAGVSSMSSPTTMRNGFSAAPGIFARKVTLYSPAVERAGDVSSRRIKLQTIRQSVG